MRNPVRTSASWLAGRVLVFLVILVALEHILRDPHVLGNWRSGLFAMHSSPLTMVGLSVLLFPSLVPLWIGAVKVTHSLWAEGTAAPVRDWIKVMAVSDVLALARAAFLYEWIQEASE